MATCNILFISAIFVQIIVCFSHRGPLQIQVRKPDVRGTEIETGVMSDSDKNNDGRQSFASPHVSQSTSNEKSDDDVLPTHHGMTKEQQALPYIGSSPTRRRHGHAPKRHHATTSSVYETTSKPNDGATTVQTSNIKSSESTAEAEEDVTSSGNAGLVFNATTSESSKDMKSINIDFPPSSIEVRTEVTTLETPQSLVSSTTKQTSNRYVSSSCPKCIRREQEKDLRLEEVKRSILTRLGLSAAPKVDGPLHPLPFDFYADEAFSMNDQEDEEEEEVDTHSVRTKEIFIFGKDVTEQCVQQKGTGCYSFNLTGQNIDPQTVASVELWMYKQRDLHDNYIQTFMVSELSSQMKKGRNILRSRNIIKRLETTLKYGWMKFYVKRTVLRWLSKPQRNKGLSVMCQTCKRRSHMTIYGDKEGLMPILVFYMRNEVPKKRHRRSVNCIEGGANCCHKEPLEITFSDIGWDYIMAPLSIRPNYCVGSCNGIEAAHYNHTRMTQTLKQTLAYNHLNLTPCCSPVSFHHPQSLIYRDNTGVVRKVDVPDLIVGECGCA